MKLPFGDKSSLISKVEKKIMKIESFLREKNKFEISKKVILEMKELSKNFDSDFKVLFLNHMPAKDLEIYEEFLSNSKIDFIYCPIPHDKKYVVKNEGHPNLKGHELVSTCLYDNLITLKNN